MKKIILWMIILLGTATAHADETYYLTLVDGGYPVSVDISDYSSKIPLTFSNGTLTIGSSSTSYTLSNLSTMYFRPATVSITIGSTGWGTYCSKYILDFSGTGLTPYKATFNDSEGTVSLSAISLAIPAESGLVLSGDAGTYAIPTNVAASALSNNSLSGTLTALTTTEAYTYYALTQIDNKVGFAKVSTGVEIPANKAYYQTSASNAPTRYVVDEEDISTGLMTIEQVENTANELLYDLQGRRVTHPQKGIYICNGKKLYIK